MKRAEGQTAAGAAGDVARRGILRVPAPGRRGATSVPQGRKSPGMTTYRGQCVEWPFGQQPRIGSLRKAAMERRTGRASLVTKTKKKGGEAIITLRWPPP